MTPLELARQLIRAKPGITTLERRAIEDAARDYITSSYASAHSKVSASRGLGLPVEPNDVKTMELLQPYLGNVTAVVDAVIAIGSGQDTSPFTAITPNPGNPKKPEDMTQQEYTAWRQAGHSSFKTSQGLLG